jgi:hypothetical protein
MRLPSELANPAEIPGAEARVLSPGDELSRLRHSSALNTEILSSLRALRERDLQRSGEQAALLAAVAAQLHSQWSALAEHASSANLQGITTEYPGGLLEDLLDYTRAWAGTLTLEREPVHLGRLLRQAVAQVCSARGPCGVQPTIQIQDNVPERVLSDALRLSKMLVQVIGAALDACDGGALSLDIYRDGAGIHEVASAADCIVIAAKAAASSEVQGTDGGTLSEAAALRAALVERLCEHMGGSLEEAADAAGYRCWRLTLPLEASADPVQASELERATAAPARTAVSDPQALLNAAAAAEGNSAAEGAIDFVYLDRQLGSLAQLVLMRTAPAFLALADERLTRLVVAQQMGDRDRIRDLAQAWKASAMSVGARSFAGLLGSAEKQAGAGHIPSEGAMRQIRDALERLRHALGTLRHVPGNPK